VALNKLLYFVQNNSKYFPENEPAAVAFIANHVYSNITCELNGPTGEKNTYRLHGRGVILSICNTNEEFIVHAAACIATGNKVAVMKGVHSHIIEDLPQEVQKYIVSVQSVNDPIIDAILYSRTGKDLQNIISNIATADSKIINIYSTNLHNKAVKSITIDKLSDIIGFAIENLYEEIVVSVNTTAAGGNASLVTIEQ
jgi:RHH-type proline utilization regulon transcriptional repressor/proline dehydrogenase/delta 1-pyrroline-5-carboxylate dehydrogenase